MKNSNNKYLSGTLWNFLDIGIFFGPFLQKINEKSKSMQKLPKNGLFFDFRILVHKTKVV